MKTLFLSDLDGTLLDGEGKLSKITASVLRPMIAQGLCFSVASARSPATTTLLLAPLVLRAPAVLLSGTLLYSYRTGEILRTFPFSAASAAELCFLLDQLQQEALAYCVKNGNLEIYYRETKLPFEQSFVLQHMREARRAFVRAESYRGVLYDADALLFLLAMPDVRRAHAAWEMFNTIAGVVCRLYRYQYGGGWLLEVYPEGVSKATGMKALQMLVGAEQVVAFGDGFNDVEMLREADVSCAVAGACGEARGAAQHHLGPCAENSVALWIAAHKGEYA